MPLGPFLGGLAIGASNQATDIMNDARMRAENAQAMTLQNQQEMEKQDAGYKSAEQAEVQKAKDMVDLQRQQGESFMPTWQDPSIPLDQKLLLGTKAGFSMNDLVSASYMGQQGASPSMQMQRISGQFPSDSMAPASGQLSPKEAKAQSTNNLIAAQASVSPMAMSPMEGQRNFADKQRQAGIEIAKTADDYNQKELDFDRTDPQVVAARNTISDSAAKLDSFRDLKNLANTNPTVVGVGGLVTKYAMGVQNLVNTALAPDPNDSNKPVMSMQEFMKTTSPQALNIVPPKSAEQYRTIQMAYYNAATEAAKEEQGGGKVSNFTLKRGIALLNNGWANGSENINNQMNEMGRNIINNDVIPILNNHNFDRPGGGRYTGTDAPPQMSRTMLDLSDAVKQSPRYTQYYNNLTQQGRNPAEAEVMAKDQIIKDKYPNVIPSINAIR